MVVLKADRLFADLLCTVVKVADSGSDVTAVHSISEAQQAISSGQVDLLITGLVATDGDVVDPIRDWSSRGMPAGGIFIVTAHKEPVVLHALAGVPVRGIFDQSSEGTDELLHACETIAAGGTYWSGSIRDSMARTCRSQDSLFRHLTFTEQLVLSVIGDGRDDACAAEHLAMSVTTVMTMRRNLHRKLGIQHKGELVRFAAVNGFVLITPHGTVRPGLATMLSMRKDRFRKRHAAAPTELSISAAHWSTALDRVA